MKDTGMIRSLDSLGRIVVPVEIRMTRNIEIGDPIEFFILNDEIIVLRKYTSTECTFCRSLDHVTYYKDQFICNTCLKELGDPGRVPEEAEPLQGANEESTDPARSGRRTKTEEMSQRLEKAIAEHPYANQKTLAEMLGISQARVSQLKRKISSSGK
ncbi:MULTISPECIES: AbrB/MazE/SpoVT family DNA-binding domain-containing protein [unclassified Paenibacillus]|uniref:AbrB/MazE/SpoVT family DNA-binding domain-containing protein n=1 Tax=unclassified Paenibacillus TaxID=185978 RepID=UPI00240651D7|nr:MULTISPECIES: AbrB/MazE/SpoVT family DNA-binding domain-containing protein [unclassified Paenibacillus]MDF9844891.1 AbrB family looped-hinge helix DNA binding protein [Paenibacillus sp. PastF-2]MDF9851490.1 AbrB family looped-hinge helix DNA binding protein [Paenibacillus sp. PastM-2]MDF9858074.1 AbrB family looped-hinge helix DNA binding protein [Paenibacillus sp. PastF-1]MDH6483339.1 AbrB family looped-hinge helix DNA binding protein [Paenibacillus sp. PastH-2]MDH6510748.1 AbrB family loo